MIESDEMSKKFKELDINGSLPISVLLGMIKLKGLNNFLKKIQNVNRMFTSDANIALLSMNLRQTR